MSLAARAYQVAYHDTPVREFHEVFDHPVSYDPSVVPSIENRVLRIRMIAEELLETARALGVALQCQSGGNEADDFVRVMAVDGLEYDPVEAADGFGDIRYLVDGGNLICGFPGELVLAEIHASNMSKAGADGKPIRREDGKILKGPNYRKPDIAKVLGLSVLAHQPVPATAPMPTVQGMLSAALAGRSVSGSFLTGDAPIDSEPLV
jgi:predicted HAD superfamily Cof-like phosphohydrolase